MIARYCAECGGSLIGFGVTDKFCSTSCKKSYNSKGLTMASKKTEAKKKDEAPLLYSPLSIEAAVKIVHTCCGFDKIPINTFMDTWQSHAYVSQKVNEIRWIAAKNLDFRAMYNIFVANAPKKEEVK